MRAKQDVVPKTGTRTHGTPPAGRPRENGARKLFAAIILNLVPPPRIERGMTGYQPIVIPFNYRGIKLGVAGGIRTPISSLTWKKIYAERTLNRVTFYKCPNH